MDIYGCKNKKILQRAMFKKFLQVLAAKESYTKEID